MSDQNESLKILQYATENQTAFLDTLEEFVRLESYAYGDKEYLTRCVRYLERLFEGIGATVSVIPVENGGDIFKAKIGKEGDTVMLLGHYDTVFPIGSLENDMPIKRDGNNFYGPGAMDMKGGIVAMYYAVKALQELDIFPEKQLLVLITGDEEAGSALSKQIIMQEARSCKAVFCPEPAPAGKDAGNFKTARFGRGGYKIIIHGKSSHSGNNPYEAESPVLEMAHLIRAIEELDSKFQDATVSIVHLHAGADNLSMIPGSAGIGLDVRFENPEVMEKVIKELYGLSPHNPRVTYEIFGEIEKPPMKPSAKLFKLAQEIGAELGLEVAGHTVAGGSDSNFTASVGVDSLDGMGMTGTGIHNKEEHIYCDGIAYRIAFLAGMIRKV